MRHDTDAVGKQGLASPVLDVHSVSFQDSVDLLHVTGGHPAHPKVLDDQLCGNFNGGQDVVILSSLLPVVHHVLYESPALAVLQFEQQHPDDGDAGVEAAGPGQLARARLGIKAGGSEEAALLQVTWLVLTCPASDWPLTSLTQLTGVSHLPQTAQADWPHLGPGHQSRVLDDELPALDVSAGPQDPPNVFILGNLPAGGRDRPGDVTRHLHVAVCTL